MTIDTLDGTGGTIGLTLAITGDGTEMLVLATGLPGDLEGTTRGSVVILPSGGVEMRVGGRTFPTDGHGISDALSAFEGRDVLLSGFDHDGADLGRDWLVSVVRGQ